MCTTLRAIYSQVCIKACTQEERYCEPMLSWSLRLDTELVLHKEFLQSATPGELPNSVSQWTRWYRSLHTWLARNTIYRNSSAYQQCSLAIFHIVLRAVARETFVRGHVKVLHIVPESGCSGWSEGTLLEQCDETGLGYRWEGDQLQGLEIHEPWQVSIRPCSTIDIWHAEEGALNLHGSACGRRSGIT